MSTRSPRSAAIKLAAAARQLPRGEPSLAEPRRPVRYERAMRGAGNRVLRYALGRREEARHEVDFRSRGGDDQGEGIERRHALEVRLEVAHVGLGIEHRHEIARPVRLRRSRAPARPRGPSEICDRARGTRREIHAEELALPRDGERAAAGRERHPVASGEKVLEQDVSGGERRVAAQVHLHGRREPAQRRGILARQHERSLGEIVLGGDRREDGVGEPLLERHHRGRISAEEPAGEGVYLVERELHILTP